MRGLLAFRVGFEKNNRIKMMMGILLAAVSFICWQKCFPGDPATLALGIVFAVAFLVFGLLNCHAETDKAAWLINVLWGVCSIAAVLVVALPTQGIYMIALNFLCASILAGFFLMITASWRPAINVTVCALALLIGLNLIVFAFRGKELVFGDIKAAGTALSVVGQYKFQVTRRFLCLCSCFVLAVFSQFSISALPAKKKKNFRVRMTALLVTLIMALGVHFGSAGITVISWAFEGTYFNGYLLNFYLGVCDSIIKAPESYAPETVEMYGNAYPENVLQEQKRPNIIAIMGEAYSDLNVYGQPLPTNVPVTPFIDSLSENTVKGYALTSIYGGKTANSEFEFLTGHSMAFLPSDSVPYQHYIFDEKCSIAWVLNSYGYSTFGTHPFQASGWSRSTVYPFLGLRDSTFMGDYPQENLIRDFVSDQEMFEYVLEHLNEDRGGQPLFLMGVTMQNHGGYLYEGEDFTETVHLTELSQEYPAADQYLSLLNETDRAMEYLLRELQNYPEDTIVIFFGDHQPNLGMKIVEELHDGSLDTLDERMLQYVVPFFIWANYDIEEAVVPCTSPNYLPRYLLECAGLELPTYYRILKDIEETIPAINAFGYYSLEKGRYATFDEAEGKEAEMLEVYENIQYNNLFDDQNRNYELFGQYLSP